MHIYMYLYLQRIYIVIHVYWDDGGQYTSLLMIAILRLAATCCCALVSGTCWGAGSCSALSLYSALVAGSSDLHRSVATGTRCLGARSG